MFTRLLSLSFTQQALAWASPNDAIGGRACSSPLLEPKAAGQGRAGRAHSPVSLSELQGAARGGSTGCQEASLNRIVHTRAMFWGGLCGLTTAHPECHPMWVVSRCSDWYMGS